MSDNDVKMNAFLNEFNATEDHCGRSAPEATAAQKNHIRDLVEWIEELGGVVDGERDGEGLDIGEASERIDELKAYWNELRSERPRRGR
jgi:hypothetical protein